MKRCLIFDLDGTLVDSLSGIAGSLNRALSIHGLPGHPTDAVRGFIGNGSRVLMQRAAPPNADEDFVDILEQEFKTDYDVTWANGSTPYPGMMDLLVELQERGESLTVLSNKPHPFTVAMVERLFPDIRFSVILGQRPGIPHKPDPAGAREILRQLGASADGSILIGDSTMDLETARNAGLKSIACTWGYHDADRLSAAGAECFAANAAELQAWLRSST